MATNPFHGEVDVLFPEFDGETAQHQDCNPSPKIKIN